MPADLPGCNYNTGAAGVGSDDLAYEQSVYKTEFLERLQLMFGNPDYITDSSWGIVAESDPTAVETSDTEPGVVSSSGITVSVLPLIAVSRNGQRMELSSTVSSVGMADNTTNAVNVVALKFSTANPAEASVSEYHSTPYRRRNVQTDPNLVVVYTLAQWNALSTDSLYDHVPLAVATVLESAGVKSLEITLSNTNYTWLRPWFSPVDVIHRSQVGTGTVSATNVHGNSFNDFSVGNFTLPMLNNHIGMVISQERSIPHVPGTVCEVNVPWGNVQQDDAQGTVTGIPSTYYIDLGFFPTNLGLVYDSTDSTKVYCFVMLPRTTIIYQPLYSRTLLASTNLTVTCARITALEPPAGVVVSQFAAGEIGDYDAVIASGNVYVSEHTITRTDTMADAGPIPIGYRFYFAADEDGNGTIVKNPQVMMCYTKLSDIGSGITPSITQFARGVVLVALDQAAAGASLDVQVRITGLDINGASTSEVLSFDNTWTQATIPSCYTTPAAFQKGTTTFSSITSVSLDTNLNAGDNAAIQVWVLMDELSDQLNYAAIVAKAQWDSSKFCTIYDHRQVHYDMQGRDADDLDQNALYYASLYDPDTQTEPAYTRGITYYESFERPQYHSLVSSDAAVIDIPPDFTRSIERLDGVYRTRDLVLPHAGVHGVTQNYVYVFLLPGVRPERNVTDWETSNVYYMYSSVAGVWPAFWTLMDEFTPAADSGILWHGWRCTINLGSLATQVRIAFSAQSLRGFVIKHYYA